MAKPSVTTQHLRDMIKSKELIQIAQDSLEEDGRKLSSADVGIIKLLLNKTMPDLKGVEQTTTMEGSVTHSINVNYVDTDSQ